MMEAVRTSETLVYLETTWHYIPESCHLHTSCHEDLKSTLTLEDDNAINLMDKIKLNYMRHLV
jgi:hypothetical protein